MSPSIEIEKYSSVFAIDTQVILEAKPLHDLPWRELDAVGPILLLALPQVLVEVDSKKRDGRIGQRARSFNRLLGPSVETGMPTCIAKGPPAVDLVVCPIRKIDWAAFDDLDPEQGDDRIVLEALHAHLSDPSRLRVLSHDMRPRAGAIRHGIAAVRVPDSWLPPPEPSPAEKEIQRLKQKVSRFEASSPSLEVTIEFLAPSDLTVPRILPLTSDEMAWFVDTVIRNNPRFSNTGPLGDYSYPGRYKRFKDSLPLFVKNYHRQLELLFGQFPVKITIRNVGYVTAKDLVIEMTARNGAIYNKFVFPNSFGPSAPVPKSPFELPMSIMPEILKPPNPYEIVFSKRGRGPELRAVCGDFRHGHTETLAGVLSINPHAEGPFSLDVRLTASNLNGDVFETVELPFQTIEKVFTELINLEKEQYIEPFPMMDMVNEAIQAGKFDAIEIGESDES